MSIYCFCKYCDDEDVSMITYKHFHDSEDGIYPSFSMCFYNPFKKEKLEMYGVNISLYSEYLQGMYWDPIMEKIDYEEVTLQIDDHLCDVTMDAHDLTWIDYQSMKAKHHKTFGNRCHNTKNLSYHKVTEPYVHYKSGFNKCFTFDIPYQPQNSITYFSINLRSTIFPNGLRPPRADFDVKRGTGSGFYIAFHYPQQFFRADRTIKRTWNPLVHIHGNDSNEELEQRNKLRKNYEMRFRISDLTVSKMRHRSNWQSKSKQNCNPVWKKDDQMSMSAVMEKAGCKLPYWDADEKLETCTSKEAMRQVQPLSNVNISKEFPPPCLSIKKITYQYEEVELKDDVGYSTAENNSSWFRIVLLFYDQTYKEISQIKAYDMEMLIGNIGGYLGLFLGYAILQIPDLLVKGRKWIIFKFQLLRNLIYPNHTTLHIEPDKNNISENVCSEMHCFKSLVKVTSNLDQLTNRLKYLENNFERLSDIVYKIKNKS